MRRKTTVMMMMMKKNEKEEQHNSGEKMHPTSAQAKLTSDWLKNGAVLSHFFSI